MESGSHCGKTTRGVGVLDPAAWKWKPSWLSSGMAEGAVTMHSGRGSTDGGLGSSLWEPRSCWPRLNCQNEKFPDTQGARAR